MSLRHTGMSSVHLVIQKEIAENNIRCYIVIFLTLRNDDALMHFNNTDVSLSSVRFLGGCTTPILDTIRI